MRDICDIFLICYIYNMLKEKFLKKLLKKEEERKKEKVGVRICWLNQQIKKIIFLT